MFVVRKSFAEGIEGFECFDGTAENWVVYLDDDGLLVEAVGDIKVEEELSEVELARKLGFAVVGVEDINLVQEVLLFFRPVLYYLHSVDLLL